LLSELLLEQPLPRGQVTLQDQVAKMLDGGLRHGLHDECWRFHLLGFHVSFADSGV
jgi:hypothetical protein